MKTLRSFELFVLGALSLLVSAHAHAASPPAAPNCVFNCPVMTETSASQLVCGSDGNPHPSRCMLQYASCLHPKRVDPDPVAPEVCAFFGTLSSGDPNFAGIITTPVDPTSHDPSNGNNEDETADETSNDSSSSGDGDSSETDSNQVIIVIIEEDTPPPTTGDATPTAAPTKSPSVDENHDFGDDPLFQNTEWTITLADGSSSGDSSGSGDSDGDNTRCEIMCMTRYEPVCASNGATYSNSCELSVARCMDPTLTSVHAGNCISDMVIVLASPEPPSTTPYPLALEPTEQGYDPCAYVCPMFDAPVCSRDGQIYDNGCVYASAYCRDSTLADATTEICMGGRV